MAIILQWMETYSPWILVWFGVFTCVNAGRILHRFMRKLPAAKDSAGYTELAGLPLTFLQPICFVKAVMIGSLPGMIFFMWWGPGFILTLLAVGIARLRAKRIDWSRLATPISWACKIYYLIYIYAFYAFGLPTIAFTFSVWIINDQIEKLFMSLDADRTRRTFHDKWIPRLAYPLGLFIPIFCEVPYQPLLISYGLLLFFIWTAGLIFVYKKGKFFDLPDDPSLLRNMTYFGKLRVT